MIPIIKKLIMAAAISLFAVACATDRCIETLGPASVCNDSDCTYAKKINDEKSPVIDNSGYSALLNCGDYVDDCAGTKEPGSCSDW